MFSWQTWFSNAFLVLALGLSRINRPEVVSHLRARSVCMDFDTSSFDGLLIRTLFHRCAQCFVDMILFDPTSPSVKSYQLLLLPPPPAAAAAGANILPKKEITVSVALFGAGGRYGRETPAERGNVYRRQNL